MCKKDLIKIMERCNEVKTEGCRCRITYALKHNFNFSWIHGDSAS